jgi:hypothetical protein
MDRRLARQEESQRGHPDRNPAPMESASFRHLLSPRKQLQSPIIYN